MARALTKQEPDAYVTKPKWIFAAPMTKSTTVVVPDGFKITQVAGRKNAPSLMRTRPDTTGANVGHATSYAGRKAHKHNASFR